MSNMVQKPEELGKALKYFRLEREMTQAQLAEFLGISRAGVARIEAGKEVGDLTRHKLEKKIGKILELSAA